MLNAQDNKPNKEETITFIEEYFNNSAGMLLQAEFKRNTITTIYKYNITQLEFYNNLLMFYINKSDFVIAGRDSYTNYFGPYMDETKEVDISTVEKINLLGEGDTHFVYFLEFKIMGESEPVRLPFLNSDKRVDFETLKNYQIYKAFQHLRKLCSAPEPISFD
jgi:hypothetical protein